MISGVRRLVQLIVCAYGLICVQNSRAWQLDPLVLNLDSISAPTNQLLTPLSQNSLSQPLSVSHLLPQIEQAAPSQPQSTPRPVLTELAKSALSGLSESILQPEAQSAPTPPKPAGKILEAGLKSVLEQVSNTNGSHVVEAAKQVAKSRKQSELTGRNQGGLSNLEQIINQHAKLHPTSGSHQRLVANTERDHKILGSLSSGDSSGPSSFSLSGLVDRLRSAGISSRSSIVKAISDNRLTRTVAEAGKSIGSNKYVAGAAAASAIAAIGLTLGKLIAPQLFAGGFAKVGDPMTSSASSLAPQSFDRIIYEPTSSGQPAASMYSRPYLPESYMNMAPAYETQMAPSASQPASAYADPNAPLLYRSPASPNQFYLHYAPQQPVKATSSEPSDATSGYYSSFYSSQAGAADVSGNAGGIDAGLVEPLSQPPQTTSYSDFNGRPALVEQPERYNGDYMYAAPSYDQPAKYAQPPRRSGTVTLRMDEATRKRLLEHLKSQQERLQPGLQDEARPISAQVYVPARVPDASKQTRSPQVPWQPSPLAAPDRARLPGTSGKQEWQVQPSKEQGQLNLIVLKANKGAGRDGQTSWRSSASAGDARASENWRSLAITSSETTGAFPSGAPESAVRISRTPNQSSVKVRHPNELSKDYGFAVGSETANIGDTSNQAQPAASAPAPQVSTSSRQLAVQPLASGQQELFSGVKLSANNNKNNVIKPTTEARPTKDLAIKLTPAVPAQPDGPEIVVLDGGAPANNATASPPTDTYSSTEENGTPKASQQVSPELQPDDEELENAAS